MKLAVIPARGGSKRIPRKNLREFCGKPMIVHSIHAARDCALFERIIVSTEDPEIAAVARAHGAEVPFMRPAALADDHTGTLAVMRHAVQACRALQWNVEEVCCLYATAPFVTVQDLRRGLELLQGEGVQYAFSATDFDFAIQRAIRLKAGGAVEPVWPENMARRSQDLEPLYHDAGQFYWGRAEAFATELPIFAAHSRAVLLPRARVQDIDTPDDWQRAEWIYRSWMASEPRT